MHYDWRFRGGENPRIVEIGESVRFPFVRLKCRSKLVHHRLRVQYSNGQNVKMLRAREWTSCYIIVYYLMVH